MCDAKPRPRQKSRAKTVEEQYPGDTQRQIRESHSKSRTRKDQPKIGNLKTRSSSEQLNKL